MANDNEWLILAYKLPSHPSRMRVNIWRKLKKAGAVYYQQGVALLPQSEHFLKFMLELKREIASYGGNAVLANFRFMDPEDSKRAIDEFNAGLSREYFGIKETFNDIMDDIERSRKENHLSVSYFDERLSTIKKLKKAYETVKKRDCFKVRLTERVEDYINMLLKKVQHYYSEFIKTARTAN